MNDDQKITKLLQALDLAIVYIQGITGGDESATLDHLCKIYDEVQS